MFLSGFCLDQALSGDPDSPGSSTDAEGVSLSGYVNPKGAESALLVRTLTLKTLTKSLMDPHGILMVSP